MEDEMDNDDNKGLTPMMRQYLAIKRERPEGEVLCFRIGDYWDVFGYDAKRTAAVLCLPLTLRGGTPMCGFHCSHTNSALAQMVRAGIAVALADVVEVNRRGLPRREVVRHVSPGVYASDGK